MAAMIEALAKKVDVAIAAVGGIQPDVSTLACPAGSACLNHLSFAQVERAKARRPLHNLPRHD